MSGALILVVGRSGVGKDSVLDGAREALGGDGRFVFARRVITRKADPAAEDHDALSEDAFLATESHGMFALSWRAHGLCYGIPVTLEEDMAAGRTVIANVSRAIIPAAYERYPQTHVLMITARPEVIAERLAARGRETAEEIRQRMARVVDMPPGDAPVRLIENDSALTDAVADFVAAVTEIHTRTADAS